MYTFKNSPIVCVNEHYKRTLQTFAILLMTCAVSNAALKLPPGNAVQQWNTIAENTVVGSGAFHSTNLSRSSITSARTKLCVCSVLRKSAVSRVMKLFTTTIHFLFWSV